MARKIKKKKVTHTKKQKKPHTQGSWIRADTQQVLKCSKPPPPSTTITTSSSSPPQSHFEPDKNKYFRENMDVKKWLPTTVKNSLN